VLVILLTVVVDGIAVRKIILKIIKHTELLAHLLPIDEDEKDMVVLIFFFIYLAFTVIVIIYLYILFFFSSL
jgi:hypothetical protein